MRPKPLTRRALLYLTVVSLFLVIIRFPGIARAWPRVQENDDQWNKISDDSLHVILYSGPTGLPSDKQLYHDNFIYFLNHGLPCSYHAGALSTPTIAIISLTEKNFGFYNDIISIKNTTCGDIYTFVRQDKCYDMETVRLFLKYRHMFNLGYKYSLFYVNCGMLGPLPKVAKPLRLQPHWTEYFRAELNGRVKLVSMITNCGGMNAHRAHVGSEMWATDVDGLQAIIDSPAVYDCAQNTSTISGELYADIIDRYELGLSSAVMDRGYEISAFLSPWNFASGNSSMNSSHYPPEGCSLSDGSDIWSSPDTILRRLPQDAINPLFYKTSRNFPDFVLKAKNMVENEESTLK